MSSYLCDHGYPMGEGCSLCTLPTQQAPEPRTPVCKLCGNPQSNWQHSASDRKHEFEAESVPPTQQAPEPRPLLENQFRYPCPRCESTGKGGGIDGKCWDCKGSGSLVGAVPAAQQAEEGDADVFSVKLAKLVVSILQQDEDDSISNDAYLNLVEPIEVALKSSQQEEMATITQVLRGALDRDWQDETPTQIAIIAANGIYWRDRKLKDVEAAHLAEQAKARADKDGAYEERNRLVALLSSMFPSSLERHPDEDLTWSDDWRWVVYIDFPYGQASWHIHDSQLSLFDHLKRFQGRKWDGHSTEQKYASVAAMTILMQENETRYAAEQAKAQVAHQNELEVKLLEASNATYKAACQMVIHTAERFGIEVKGTESSVGTATHNLCVSYDRKLEEMGYDWDKRVKRFRAMDAKAAEQTSLASQAKLIRKCAEDVRQDLGQCVCKLKTGHFTDCGVRQEQNVLDNLTPEMLQAEEAALAAEKALEGHND